MADDNKKVSGKIVDKFGVGQKGLLVKAFNKNLTSVTQLGATTTTDASGNYSITYTQTELNPFGKISADLLVRVFDDSGETEEQVAESPVILQAGVDEVVNLTTAGEDFVGISEFNLLRDKITPSLSKIDINAIDPQGMAVLASGIDTDVYYVNLFVKSKQLVSEISIYPEDSDDDIKTHEVLYGLLRFDLPTDFPKLLKISESRKTQAITTTAASNIINKEIENDIPAILDAFRTLLIEVALDTDSYLADLLTIAGIDTTLQKAFYTEYLSNGDLGEGFWTHIEAEGILTAIQRDAVKQVFQLSAITQKHLPLISILHPGISSIEDLTGYTRADWLGFINQAGVGLPNYPEDELTPELIDDYADALLLAVADSFPGSLYVKLLSPDNAGPALLDFADNNPTYDISNTSPVKYIHDNPEALTGLANPDQSVKELHRAKRLFHLTGNYDKAATSKVLADNELDSATKITSLGKRTFVKKYAAQLGGIKETEKIYNTAVKRAAASVALLATYNSGVNTLSTNVFHDGPDISQNTLPDLEKLFGSQDFCDCEHCRSSFSPAAYLVDVLTFIRNAENVSPDAQSLSAWNYLKARRPEFEEIELTCKNTNTTLPYIDLVNEVLEHAVSPSTGTIDRQTEGTSELLLAEPDHINTGAYDILAQAEYPWKLPFNLWNEEAKVYLNQLKIDRADLIKAFEKTTETTETTIATAAVYLGISSKALDIITDTSNTLNAYYGGTIAAELQHIPTLLEKAGLDYQNLLALLETQFINPGEKKITFTPSASCSLDNASIDISDTELRKLHRFSRLQHILGWSAKELDMAITAFNAPNINDTFIIQLSGIKRLEKQFGLAPAELLTWYNRLSDKHYEEGASQYEEIFLNHASISASGTDVKNIFEAADDQPVELLAAGELNSVHASVVLGALRIKAQDLMLLLEEELPSGSANKEELANLYRIASFARTMRLKIADYFLLKKIIGISPISTVNNLVDTDHTIRFIESLSIFENADISPASLGYLFYDTITRPFSNAADAKLAAELTGVRQVTQNKLADKGITAINSRETLLNSFLLLLDEDLSIRSVDIIEDTTITNAEVFIDQYWIATGHISGITAGDILNTISGQIDLPGRYTYVVTLLYPQLADILSLHNEANQYLAEAYSTTSERMASLLALALKDPSNPDATALSLFTRADFVFNTDEIGNTDAFTNHFFILKQLLKIIVVVEKLNIQTEDINFVLNSIASTGWFDLRSFHTANAVDNIEAFTALIQAFDLEKQYAVKDGFSVVKMLKKTNENESEPEASDWQLMAESTGWNIADINYLINTHFTITDFRNEQWVVSLSKVLSITGALGASPHQALGWTGIDVSADQAQELRLAVKATYSRSAWIKIAAELRDFLRIKQRNALTAYIIHHNTHGITNPDDLYAYYLIDPEVAPCVITSRIKLAISSVQLWVQRIRMDLEPAILFSQEDLDEWNWRKNYRVWEAARKIFIYPENWIEPELRDDKSPFYEDMEDELLQEETTAETAEKVYLNYLNKLDEVAHLEIGGLHKEEDNKVYHVFGRTRNSPHIYYYRRWEDGFRWTAWEKLDLDIEGEHLIPVIFNRRPMLFWPIMNEKAVEPTQDDLNSDTPKLPVKKIEVQMAYSEFKNNKWQPKKISKNRLLSQAKAQTQDFFFKTFMDEEGLSIDTYIKRASPSDYASAGRFFLNNCTAEIETKPDAKTTLPAEFIVSNSERNFMKTYQNEGGNHLAITEKLLMTADDYDFVKKLNKDIFTDEVLASMTTKSIKTTKRKILGKTPTLFKITYPISGQDLLSSKPFFYEDKQRTFFVVPEGNFFMRQTVIDAKPIVLINEADKPTEYPSPTDDIAISENENTIPSLGDENSYINSGGGNGGILSKEGSSTTSK